MTTQDAKVWVVLVNWNGWQDSIECLESLFRQHHGRFTAVVCDNDSSDGSVEQIRRWAAGEQAWTPPSGPLASLTTPPLPKPLPHAVIDDPAAYVPGADSPPLLIVRTGGNLGFAGGNNVGIRLALRDPGCDFVWLLNNDTVVPPDCLTQMLATAQADPKVGITGPTVAFYRDPDVIQALGGGSFSRYTASGRLLCGGKRRSALSEQDERQARERLHWVSGASMLASRAFLEKVGEMEERYFLYFEEIDWALRSEREFRPGLAADAVVYHKAGSSTGEQTESSFSVYTMCRARVKLYRKFMPFLLPAVYLRAAKEVAQALLRGQKARADAIWRASRDEIMQS